MENETLQNSGNANESVVTDVQANNVEQNINNQTSKTNDDDYVEFDDGESEIETSEENTNEKQKTKPTKEQSRIYAQKRREREAKEKEERYKQGVKDALGGINPFTQEKMEDDADYEVYIEMQECNKAGYDPLTEFHKYQAEKKRKAFQESQKELEEKQALEKNEKETKERIDKDMQDFNEKHKDIDLMKLFKDERFSLFAEGKLGTKPLTDIYEDFVKFENGSNEKAKTLAVEKYARVISSPGSLNSSSSETAKQVNYKAMSREEFAKIYKQKTGKDLY